MTAPSPAPGPDPFGADLEQAAPLTLEGVGGGAPLDAYRALEHYTDGPEPGLSLMSGGPDVSAAPATDAGVPIPIDGGTSTPASSPAPDAGAPASAPPTTDPSTPATDAGAPATKPGRGTQPAQNAKWTEVSAADKKLDIDWIGDKQRGLHPEVRESIDGSYSNEKHSKRIKKTVDQGLKQVDKDNAAELEKARDAAATAHDLKRDRKSKRYSKKDLAEIEKDPKFIEEKAALAKKRAEAEAKLRADYDASVSSGKREQSVTNPDTATIARDEGKSLARTNFMSWASYLMEDPEKVKAHFLGIKGTAGDSNMLMADDAGRRFELAKAQFEKENPGYTMPTTGVAHSMRGLHEKRMGLGMLGHALGLAVDYSAYENPNLKGDDKEQPGLNSFMLKRFGGGRTMMSIDEDDVEQLGKNTVKSASTAKDKEISARVTQQFGEIAQTSENFQKSLTPKQMGDLRDSRNLYFDTQAKERSLGELQKQLKSPKLKDKAKKEELAKQIQTLQQEVIGSKKLVDEGLQTAFNPWTSSLSTEISMDAGVITASQLTADTYKTDAKGFGKLGKDQVDAYALSRGMGKRADFKKSKQHATYEAMVKAEMAKREKAAREKVTYASNSNKVKQALIDKLHDPKKVFGKGNQNADKTWSTEMAVTEVPVMQLLEHGFIKNDKMQAPPIDPKTNKPDPSWKPNDPKTNKPRKQREAVFNAKTAEMLARYGFAPGSNFGDTMHFDFIEGYSNAVKGGRHGENMKKLRFSPEGEFIAPPKPEKKPTAPPKK